MSSPVSTRLEAAHLVAAAWNRAGIRYALMHGLEQYPERVGRDLDILIEPAQAAAGMTSATTALRAAGYVVRRPHGLWGPRLLVTRDDSWSQALEFHGFRRLSWRNAVLARRPNPQSRVGPFPVDEWAAFAKRVLMPLAGGDAQRFVQRRAELALSAGQWQVIEPRLLAVIGAPSTRQLWDLLGQADVAGLQQFIPRLRRQLSWRAGWRQPLAGFSALAASLGRKLAQPFSPCAPIVALVGPDGVGKSSVLRELVDGDKSVFTSIATRHWRPNLLPRLGALAGRPAPAASADGLLRPRRQAGRFAWLRALYYSLDIVLGYYLKDRIDSSRQRLVLYDRCPLDMVVDPVRYGVSSPRPMQWLWRWLPKPDLIILLHEDAEVIHTRKPELVPAEIARQISVWQELLRRGQIQAAIRVNKPPIQVAEQVRRLVMRQLFEGAS